MTNISIGTSGYSYTEWVGPVYPKGTKAELYLDYYSTLFPTVELNFSYYRMPEASQLQAMHEKNKSLLFSIKAHESLTHTINTTEWRTAARTFCHAITPLLEADVLKAILLQFPYSFHYEPEQRRYLDALLRFLPNLPLAVEFRNGQWYNNRTLEALRKRQVTLVALDLPAIQSSPPIMDVITAPLTYLRLHGRNKETWWGSDAASRYDYLYTEKELAAIAERVWALATNSSAVLVYFNNHRRGQAVQNARSLQELMLLRKAQDEA